MHWHEQYDKEHQPTMAQIGAYVASPLWDALTGHLHNTYGITPRIAYSGCSMEQNRWKGWNIKYQKGGKSLCTLYPKQGHFLALLPLSLLEMSEAEVLVDTCSPYTQRLFHRTACGHSGKSLAFEVTVQNVVEGIKRLMLLRLAKR